MGECAVFFKCSYRYAFKGLSIGCLVRIAVGMNKEKKEQVYRIAMVLGILNDYDKKGLGNITEHIVLGNR
jgi:hypothetical protein